MEDIAPWCYVTEDAPIDQKHSCISLTVSRDISFSYSSCGESHSALCKTTEKICNSPVTVTSTESTTIQQRNKDTLFSISSNSSFDGGKKNFLQFTFYCCETT